MKKKHLDQIALDVEFLLISVIQGVALGALAGAASDSLTFLHLEALPYLLAGFLFILVFWSGAIIHAISFVDWPIDLIHSFLYFLASLIEILAITHLASPVLWFFFMFLFQVVALVLYAYDLKLIKQHKKKFSTTKSGRELYAHMVASQKNELYKLVPFSLVFNAVVLVIILFNQDLFLGKGLHLIFILFQVAFALVFLLQEVSSFKKRSEILSSWVK